MKACKQFLLERGGQVVKTFMVSSKSEKGKLHVVQLFGDWHLECDCAAGCFKQPCRHKCLVAERLAKVGIIIKGQVSLIQVINEKESR